jgi:hypothetical protein
MHEALGAAVRPLLEDCIRRLVLTSQGSVRVQLDDSIRKGAAPTGGQAGANGKVCLKILTPRLSQLLVARSELQKTLSCSRFVSPDNALLFTVGARHRMRALSELVAHKPVADQFYLHWDRRTMIVLVYGSLAQRMLGIQALERLAQDLRTRYVQSVLFIKPACKVAVRSSVAELKDRSGVDQIVLHGLRLHVMGTGDAVKALEARLAGKTDAEERRRVTRNAVAGGGLPLECCVCYGDLDEQRYELVGCGHTACKDCLGMIFHGIENGDCEFLLPVTCPLCVPKERWALSDIIAVASPQALGNLKSAAVTQHVLATNGEVVNCTVKGCNQLISTPADRKPIAGSAEEAMLGGYILCCDQCELSYCHTCTSVLQQTTCAHKGYSCADNQLRAGTKVVDHVRHITDVILAIRCPKCTAQFIDFEGCFALTCGACNCAFCAYCLQGSSNSSTCHEHVLKCPLGNGEYFNTPEAFKRSHRVRWEREVIAFLRTFSSDRQLQKAVAEEAKVHLAFVGIVLSPARYA